MVMTSAVAPAGGKEIGPDANLCAEINALMPGETLLLRPGDYRGPCRIRRGGAAGAPITVAAQSLAERPRIVYDGSGANVIEIRADYVTLRGLKIGPTQRHVDAVRIFSRAGVTVEDCEFARLGGIAIAATHHSINGFVVRRNIVTENGATAMYFGCHDGSECEISGLLVERNFIRGVDAPEPEIGYGIQVKLNSSGIIRDNVIVETKGPGIMVYGALDPTKRSVVERNFVSGSRRSSGILIGGGPAIVRNNVVMHNFEGGITLQDYGNRGLLRQITVANNTSYRNANGEFVVPAQAKLSDSIFAHNAAAAEGKPALPRSQDGLKLVQNVDCSTIACFADPAALDFSPLAGSVLDRRSRANAADMPADDFFGRSRNGSATAGAVAFPGPPIILGIKPE